MSRTNIISVIVGTRNTGKTTFAKNSIDLFPQPKCLIVDTFDNPVWRTMETYDHPEWVNRRIPVIKPDELELHKAHAYRVFSSEIEEIEIHLDSTVKNTAVILEDATRWFGSTLTKLQKRYLLNSKQLNNDFYIFFHTLSSVPPDLLKYADFLTIFKTGEGSFDHKKYHQPAFAKAFELVSNSKDQYINKTIRLK